MKEIIGIYADFGTLPNTVIRSLAREVRDSYRLHAIVAEDLDDDNFFNELALFVMPGGADLAYCSKLNGGRNARLREWVENEGVYLGKCAGAYYGCTNINFEGAHEKIAGKRELGFLNGTAVGSISEIAEPYDGSLRSAAIASLMTPKGNLTAAYYNGGPYFKYSQKEPNVNVLAWYEKVELPAIVEVNVGRGKAILSGVHAEVSAEDIKHPMLRHNTDLHPQRDNLIFDLENFERQRRKLWRNILSRCGLELSPQ